MESMVTDTDSKKLCNLRVIDLRSELEKRGLDKTGVKTNLIERLQKALVEEGKDPEEYEFDLSDKNPTKSFRLDEQGTNIDQSTNDSLVLMIETPNLDSKLDTLSELEKENEVEISDENIDAESPLNLSTEAEDEILMLNSGNEQETSDEKTKVEDEKIKVEDEKIAVSNNGACSDNSKELDTAGKEQNHDKDNDEGETGDADVEEEEAANREAATMEDNPSESIKHDDSTPNENTTSGVPTVPSTTTKTSSESEKEKDKNEKDKEKDKAKSNPGRSLWVTNLLPSTQAQELKHLLSQHGKVIGAKVVQSSRYPRQRCYGYVTMETREAADLCIEKLNNTELKGQIIRVAKVRPEHSLPIASQKQPTSKDKDNKKRTPEKNCRERSVEKKKTSSPTDKNNDIKRESRSTKKPPSVSKSSDHQPNRKPDKTREESDRQRQRERERILREEEKRRREMQRVREIEKRQREEAMRLEREREKLRIERERLDRQREEIMRLERERQRLEREKLEQEKQELRRQQLRLEEARRPIKRPSSSSTSTYKRDDDHKRITTERHYDETPPPPRFDASSRDPSPEIPAKKDKPRIAYPKRGNEYKRDYSPEERHTSHIVHNMNSSTNPSKYESSTYVNRERERDIHEPTRREAIISSVSKDTRYEERSNERSPLSYRPVRDQRERRPPTDHHAKRDRYTEPALKEDPRYRDGNSWHTSGTPAVKPFSENWSKADNWRPIDNASNERWGSNSSRLVMSSSSGVPNSPYYGGNSNMTGMAQGMTCTPPTGNSSYYMDRFENYKPLNSSRKY